MNNYFRNKAVFLITVDALRPDHLKLYGYHRNTAPKLEKFAQKGTVFLNAITNGPETPTAFSALFTSILPFLDGGYSPLPHHKIAFPQILKESGIYTYSIHSNPNLGRFFNYDRGFDVFLDGERYKTEHIGNRSDNLTHIISFYLKKILDYKNLFKKFMYKLKGFNNLKSWVRRKLPFLTELLLPFTPIAYNAPYLVNKLTSLFREIKKPIFVWAHFMDVHSPYNPPYRNLSQFRKDDFNISEKEFLLEKVYSKSHDFKITQDMVDKLIDLYDGEIHFVDEYLGEFLNLVNLIFKNDCLIIVAADHGESFYEHKLFGHQGSVYEELLKIPLLIVEIGKKPNMKKIYDTVQLIDIAPTILEFFGLDIPDNYQGQSLLPSINGAPLVRDDPIISECFQNNGIMKRNQKEGSILMSIRKKNEWKYIYDEEKEEEYLFHLKEDRFEKNNLIKDNLVMVNEFREIRDKHIQNYIESSKEKSKIMSAISKIHIENI
ncbi:MAG: sulfatase-like hydrolase/transferase [Promethearchaeota archaeon]|jgi:arylsulfatase A-like enzyme